MNGKTLYDDDNYVVVVKTKLSERAGIDALREGWYKVFGSYPSNEALAILASQSALETGRWQKINNFNFGNLKMKDGQEFTLFATGENIWNKETKKSEWHWFEPPHYQTAFRSYNKAVDGASDYIQFLSDRKSTEAWRNEAYKVAFKYLEDGKPNEYSYALYKAGYYTANPEKYTAGIVKLYNEFLKKINEFYHEVKIVIPELPDLPEDIMLAGSVPVIDHFENLEKNRLQVKAKAEQSSNVVKKSSVKSVQAPLLIIGGVVAAIYAWVSGLL